MYHGYYDFRPYVSVAQRQANAKQEIAKILKNQKPNQVAPNGKKIVETFWGKAWCDNLETYSDFENRMPRGRTYIRNGSVVHLEIVEGMVTSYVAGSDLYKIVVKIDPLSPETWQQIKKKCAGEIGSLVELLQGKLSKNVLSLVTDKTDGLFPKPKEIKLDCSCPDWATMCKHVAATLYGVGVLLDKSPELFFKLRGVDHLELIDTSVSVKMGKKDKETLDDSSLQDIFGVELADSLAPKATKKAPSKKAKVAKKVAKKVVKKVAKKGIKKVVKKVVKKTVKAAVKKVAKKQVKPAVKKVAKKQVKKVVKKQSFYHS